MNHQRLSGRKPTDTTRICLKEGWEVCYWTHELDLSEEELAQAMRQVGDNVEAVRGYFRSQYREGGRQPGAASSRGAARWAVGPGPNP